MRSSLILTRCNSETLEFWDPGFCHQSFLSLCSPDHQANPTPPTSLILFPPLLIANPLLPTIIASPTAWSFSLQRPGAGF